jgi:hypothetical protein
MKIILTAVGIALAVVITVVAGVYGWAVMTGRRTTPEFLAAADTASLPKETEPNVVSTPNRDSTPAPPPAAPPQPTFTPQPPVPFSTTSPTPAPSKEGIASTPAATASGSPAGPAGTPTSGPSALATPAPPSIPVAPAATPAPQTNAATIEKLFQLQPGIAEDQVAAVMGSPGTEPAGFTPYRPIGWYERRWINADGSWIAAVFNDAGLLVALDQYKVPGASEWTSDPHYAIASWMNANLENNRMPVRIPALDVVQSAPSAYQFQGALTADDGTIVGSITGVYYPGDGATTYIPGETLPYSRAIEGTYQYALATGAADSNTFALVEH